LNEYDLVRIRQALEKPTLNEAIDAVEKVITELWYLKPTLQELEQWAEEAE
jgi:hypothetical protein